MVETDRQRLDMSENLPQNDAEGPPPPLLQDTKDTPDVPRTSGQDQGVQDVRLIGQPTGWAAMANNMKEFDGEKVANVKDDIDSLLVFAGLFSAVLTAFVVESYQRLSPDTTSAILATSSQSLAVMQQISLQMSNASIQPLHIDINATTPPFQPSSADIHTNVLWFSSLILSLMTASFGILAKQWLREYTIYQNSSPQARLRVRHYRYLALQRWQVLEIAAVLPLFQQLALGLFFIGLCYFTMSVHESIGHTSVPLVVAWAFLFVAAIFLPIFIPRCPYKTTLLNSIFTAIHLSTIQALVRLLTWWLKKGLPALLELALWWNKRTPRETPQVPFKSCGDRLGHLMDAYISKNDETKIAQQDTADLDILGEADALRSNDDLLGTTIFESIKQLHEPAWDAIVDFMFRLVEHRLPLSSHSNAESPEPQQISLRNLSQSAYTGIIDILSHFLPPQISMEPPNPDASHQDLTKRVLQLFFSESRYPLPASGIRLLRICGGEIEKSMLALCLQTEARIVSLLQAVDQIVKLDPKDGFLLREHMWDALIPSCIRPSNSLSLDHLLRFFDLSSCNDRHLHTLMSALARHCLESHEPSVTFRNVISVIQAIKYDDAICYDIMVGFAYSCLQSADPSASIHSLIVAIDEILPDCDSPSHTNVVIALAHGCLQVGLDPFISLGHLVVAIRNRLYEKNDHCATMAALTRGCSQTPEPATSLRYLIAAIDNEVYEGSDRFSLMLAVTLGCLKSEDPAASLFSLITAMSNTPYTVHDEDGGGDLNTNKTRTSGDHIKFLNIFSILTCICCQSALPEFAMPFHHPPEVIEHLRDTIAYSYEEFRNALGSGHHLDPIESASLFKQLMEAADSGATPQFSLIHRRDPILRYLQTMRQVFLRESDVSKSSPSRLTVEQSFQVFEIIANIIFNLRVEEAGTSSGNPGPTFTLETDLTALHWDENVWPVSITDEALEYIANLVASATERTHSGWESTMIILAHPRFKSVLGCMWHLAALGTRVHTLMTLSRVITDCLSEQVSAVALLEALGQARGEAVVYVYSNILGISQTSAELIRPLRSDDYEFQQLIEFHAYDKLKLFKIRPHMIENLIEIISNFSMIRCADVSTTKEPTQQATGSRPENHLPTVSHALKITCLAVHLVGEPNMLKWGYRWKTLFAAVIQLVYSSVDVTSVSGTTGQVDDITTIAQLARGMQRSSNLQKLNQFAILAKCCIDHIRPIADLFSQKNVDNVWNEEFMKMLWTIYIATSPLDKDVDKNQELLDLPGLVEEVRKAIS